MILDRVFRMVHIEYASARTPVSLGAGWGIIERSINCTFSNTELVLALGNCAAEAGIPDITMERCRTTAGPACTLPCRAMTVETGTVVGNLGSTGPCSDRKGVAVQGVLTLPLGIPLAVEPAIPRVMLLTVTVFPFTLTWHAPQLI